MPGQYQTGKAYRHRIRGFNINVGFAAFTNAVNASPQSIKIGDIPLGCIVLAVAFRLNTQFTGGGLSALTVTIGDTAGGVSRYGSAIDAFGGTVGTVYIAPTTPGLFAGPYTAADTINAIFTPDAGHHLTQATAGSIDFDIVYTIPDRDTRNQ